MSLTIDIEELIMLEEDQVNDYYYENIPRLYDFFKEQLYDYFDETVSILSEMNRDKTHDIPRMKAILGRIRTDKVKEKIVALMKMKGDYSDEDINRTVNEHMTIITETVGELYSYEYRILPPEVITLVHQTYH